MCWISLLLLSLSLESCHCSSSIGLCSSSAVLLCSSSNVDYYSTVVLSSESWNSSGSLLQVVVIYIIYNTIM